MSRMRSEFVSRDAEFVITNSNSADVISNRMAGNGPREPSSSPLLVQTGVQTSDGPGVSCLAARTKD